MDARLNIAVTDQTWRKTEDETPEAKPESDA